MPHAHRAIDLLIELAAERIGCPATWIAPGDDITARDVHVTTKTAGEAMVQIPAQADLLTITKLLLAGYEAAA